MEEFNSNDLYDDIYNILNEENKLVEKELSKYLYIFCPYGGNINNNKVQEWITNFLKIVYMNGIENSMSIRDINNEDIIIVKHVINNNEICTVIDTVWKEKLNK